MGLIAQAQKDIAQITGNQSEFAVILNIADRNGNVFQVPGLHKRINLNVDEQGNMASSVQSTCSFSETNAIKAGLSIRNADNAIDFTGFLVTIKDGQGNNLLYSVRQSMPDETLGLIVLQLFDHE